MLYVGVNQLPERMSPATATTDAERWAVELMFEGLLETVPDSEVIRYRPALAEAMPAVMPLGRSFTLPRNARWAREPGDVVDARDVRGTLDLLARPKLRAEWAADGVDVFQEIDRIDDNVPPPAGLPAGGAGAARPGHVQGDPGPLASGAAARGPTTRTSPAHPFGSGPFKYEGREQEGADRECAVFRANPFYGQRAGRVGLPWIREVRMYVPTPSSVGPRRGRRPAPPLPGRPAEPGRPVPHRGRAQGRHAGAERQDEPPGPHPGRQPPADRAAERQVGQGLSAVINREAILKAVYRAGDDKAHAALTGPFPVEVVGHPADGERRPPVQAGRRRADRRGPRQPAGPIAADVRQGRPRARAACQLIKAQIEEGTKNKEGKPLVEIELKELSRWTTGPSCTSSTTSTWP